MKRNTHYFITIVVSSTAGRRPIGGLCRIRRQDQVEESAVVEADGRPWNKPDPTAEPEPTEEPEPTAEPTAEPMPTEEPVAEELTPEEMNAVFDDFLAGMEKYNIISLEDTNVALAEDPPPFLLDVREITEVEEKGHIEGAVLHSFARIGPKSGYTTQL